MIESAKRRRWLRIGLAIVLLCVGGSLAWRYRPLSSSERKMLGTWEQALGAEGSFGVTRLEMELTSDRRFLRRYLREDGSSFTREGSWHIEDRKLVLFFRRPFWTSLQLRIRGQLPDQPQPLSYEIVETDPRTLVGAMYPPFRQVKAER